MPVSLFVRSVDNSNIKQYSFYCPGCQDWHSVNVGTGTGRPIWTFNNNLEYPTFRPSLLVRSGCKITEFKPGMACWCNYEAKYGKPAPFKCGICHLYITDGKIQYLSDCTHDYAGRLIDMIEFNTKGEL